MELSSIPTIKPSIWMPILGSGIGFFIDRATTLKTFLHQQVKIPSNYLEKHIQTILINGQAIDDLYQTCVISDDIIALSAAMPGLAGATLRKGSHLATMRHSITRKRQTKATKTDQAGVVVVKLFNLVAKDMGPKILKGSILLKKKDVEDLLKQYPSPLWPNVAASEKQWIKIRLNFSLSNWQYKHNSL